MPSAALALEPPPRNQQVARPSCRIHSGRVRQRRQSPGRIADVSSWPPLFGGNPEDLARMDQVGIRDLVAICFENLLPLPAVAELHLAIFERLSPFCTVYVTSRSTCR